ncbi:MAG TPA: MBL fold metallo-hydrolase, partial [Chitinophagaceae bacterium]
YFIQIDGERILVDPVFNGNASPFSFSVKAFKGTGIYTTDEIPPIDYLFITHDHWDHLDEKAIKKLSPKIKTGHTMKQNELMFLSMIISPLWF